MLELRGELPRKNVAYEEAMQHLVRSSTSFEPPRVTTKPSAYYEHTRQGAILFPRNFWFVRPAQKAFVRAAERPYVETDPAIDREAKKPWRGILLKGAVEREFLFATFLSKDLIPFGILQLRPVVLPVRWTSKR